MSYITIPSYEGNQPFLYVYYAEEDTRLALPVLARLYNEGIRLWSWNGCKAPTDMRASQRISSCAALLIFLSDNLDRDISREYFEAMEALRCNKVKYFVRLSDVELPFDWGKSDTNVIIDYVRSNESAFWLSIYDSDIIESCRGAWPAQPVKAGLSAFDAVDSSELSDEYSNILKIIGESPALDRSGVPINAEDIALFAGAGEKEEYETLSDEIAETEEHPEDLNRKSLEDLFGMLDEISLNTRQKAEELQQSAERRRQEQEKAAMLKASLPFQQDNIPAITSDEPPVPELSFTPPVYPVEDMAREMFGFDIEPEIEISPEPETTAEIDDQPVIIVDEIPEASSFEEFIDDLAGMNVPAEVKGEEIIEEKGEEVSEEIIEKIPEEEEIIPLATSPKTVEITEDQDTGLLPPASGSLTGFTLPDDTYMNTVYLVNDEEIETPLTAAERAAAAEESRKQFESALENAAYKVTGRIVARHSLGIHTMGLKVRKPKVQKKKINARVKTKKVSPVPVAREQNVLIEQNVLMEQPAETEVTETALSRTERRRHRRRRKTSETEAIEAAQEIIETPKKVSVTPEPMHIAPAPKSEPKPEPKPEPVSEETAPENGEETTVSRRKKRHPHNSSGLVGLLRDLRSKQGNDEAESSETQDEDE